MPWSLYTSQLHLETSTIVCELTVVPGTLGPYAGCSFRRYPSGNAVEGRRCLGAVVPSSWLAAAGALTGSRLCQNLAVEGVAR